MVTREPGAWRLWISPLYLLLLAWWVASGQFGHVTLALVALACHELAHLFVLAGFDVPVEAFELHPFGALIRYQSPPAGLGNIDAVVAAAGPLQSFLLATAAFYVRQVSLFAPEKVELFIHLNLFLACFNLIPVWPLDGGRIARAWLAPRIGDGHAVRVLARAGVWLGAAMLLLALAATLALRQAVWVPGALGLFLWRAARADASAGQQAILRSVSRKQLRGGAGPVAWLVARDAAPASDVVRRMRADRYHLVQIVDRSGNAIGQLTEEEFALALLACGLAATAGELLAHAAERPKA
jgi:stage IV sporulation protein FB